ncbi:hypothetical protein C7B62_07910 [Pleurocapsa sp. CCALA 161]|uniref:hypothetical protein n=1 Tax=Pleurocapsa sp. CCALA 161 TaxID=2107688 RepID=UPI000D053E86|nr:hypothetical protein [Pleurocapsa sp. CCALA 161]PSB10845.1 hypothetical protein C7B62_07910 [Pleurocapsa sp. CCALA 161]
MTTKQQLKLKEIKKLIGDRFYKQDEKINDIRIELAGIKVDTAYIKWLFGGLLSFILILLSVIITVIFKLIG